MEKIIIISFAISILFCVVKVIEQKITYKPSPDDDEASAPSLKPIFRDGILIFICSICSMFLIKQITPSVITLMGDISTGEILDAGSPKVFTNTPDF
jgi:hypothetical protein